jgi:hypothetical protein
MKKKRLLLVLLKMVIPNLLDVNVLDDHSCEVSYLVQGQKQIMYCSLDEYEQAASPQTYMNKTLDSYYLQLQA